MSTPSTPLLLGVRGALGSLEHQVCWEELLEVSLAREFGSQVEKGHLCYRMKSLFPGGEIYGHYCFRKSALVCRGGILE